MAISLKNLGLVNKELAQHDSGGTLQTQRQETAFLLVDVRARAAEGSSGFKETTL